MIREGTASIILPDKDFFTPKEAAKYLGVSRPTIYRWIEEGTLEGVFRIGDKLLRIPQEAVFKTKKNLDDV
jgi:excisionase family DNA binding protein